MKKQMLFLIGLGLSGCQMAPYQGEARDVRRKPNEGGVIAIQRNFKPEDRQRAEESMRSNCGALPVKIVEESEVVTGQETVANARETDRKSSETQVGSLWGMPVVAGEQGGRDTQTSTVSKQLKEWQIVYECQRSASKSSEKKIVR